jgi:hypothetical protein
MLLTVVSIVSCSREFILSGMEEDAVSEVFAVCSAGLCNSWNKRRYAFLTFLMTFVSNYI